MQNTGTQEQWTASLTDTELSEAIESTGAMSARLYAQGVDTTELEDRLDELMAEWNNRQQF